MDDFQFWASMSKRSGSLYGHLFSFLWGEHIEVIPLSFRLFLARHIFSPLHTIPSSAAFLGLFLMLDFSPGYLVMSGWLLSIVNFTLLSARFCCILLIGVDFVLACQSVGFF